MRSLYITMIFFSCMHMSIGAVIKGSCPAKQETQEEREERRRRNELVAQVAPAAVHAGIQASALLLGPTLEKYPKETLMFFTAAGGIGTCALFNYTRNIYLRSLASLGTLFLGSLTITEWRKQRAAQERLEELERRERRQRRAQQKRARELEQRHHHVGNPYYTA